MQFLQGGSEVYFGSDWPKTGNKAGECRSAGKEAANLSCQHRTRLPHIQTIRHSFASNQCTSAQLHFESSLMVPSWSFHILLDGAWCFPTSAEVFPHVRPPVSFNLVHRPQTYKSAQGNKLARVGHGKTRSVAERHPPRARVVMYDSRPSAHC